MRCVAPSVKRCPGTVGVYESVRPADHIGALAWRALGAKTLELTDGSASTRTTVTSVEVRIAARIAKNGKDPVFKALFELAHEYIREYS